jgi:hypothetical protein
MTASGSLLVRLFEGDGNAHMTALVFFVIALYLNLMAPD